MFIFLYQECSAWCNYYETFDVRCYKASGGIAGTSAVPDHSPAPWPHDGWTQWQWQIHSLASAAEGFGKIGRHRGSGSCHWSQGQLASQLLMLTLLCTHLEVQMPAYRGYSSWPYPNTFKKSRSDHVASPAHEYSFCPCPTQAHLGTDLSYYLSFLQVFGKSWMCDIYEVSCVWWSH